MMERLMNIYNLSPRVIQTVGINIYELKEWKIRKSKRFKRNLVFLKKTEKWKKEEFIDYQNKHLRNIVEYAYKNVPFYHKLYKKEGIDISKIKTVDDLQKLPIVKKEDIIKYWDSFLSSKREKFTTHHTSGTTGTPLEIRISHSLDVLDKANAYRRNLWAGYHGEWIARFVGDNPVKDCNDKTLFRKSYVMKRVIFPSYCLSLERMPHILTTLQKLNVKFIQSYPSTAYLLAKFLEKNDEYLSLKAVLYSSEPMYDFQRRLIEERFKTKAFGFYGQAEVVVSALECEEGEYHITMVDGILEIARDGKMMSSGEKGFTIVTSLHNYAMPLIRYALNDYTGYKDDDCACGRNLPLIYPVETKAEDFIVTPDGKIISPSILTFPLKHARGIIESQIVQESLDKIIVNIVPDENYTEKDERYLLNSLKGVLGENIEIETKYVKNIPQTNAFKKRFVINKLGRDYIEKAFREFE